MLPDTVVTVETNQGGDLLVEAVRARLADLPVVVKPWTRTAPRRTGAGEHG